MRKLAAALAVRNNGKRLYAKPLQNLNKNTKVIDYLIKTLNSFKEIEEVILGISEGNENIFYRDYCDEENIKYIFGNEQNVLGRLIQCGDLIDATDIFRVSTESPFIWMDEFSSIWKNHLINQNDITVTDNLPEGTTFEIYTLKALKLIHEIGGDEYRSEVFSRYPRKNTKSFKVGVFHPPKKLQRTDIRLTIDNPEDLALCREVFKRLIGNNIDIKIEKIIELLDNDKTLRDLVKNYIDPKQTLMWNNFLK